MFHLNDNFVHVSNISIARLFFVIDIWKGYKCQSRRVKLRESKCHQKKQLNNARLVPDLTSFYQTMNTGTCTQALVLINNTQETGARDLINIGF